MCQSALHYSSAELQHKAQAGTTLSLAEYVMEQCTGVS